MNRRMLAMVVLLSGCLLCSCSKYQHSNEVKIYDKEDTESLSADERAAIEEEEEFMRKSKNIAFEGFCEELKELGLKEELEPCIYKYLDEDNNIQVLLTSRDGEYCANVRLSINPEYFQNSDNDKELSDILWIICSNIDDTFDETSLEEILKKVPKVKLGGGKNYKRAGKLRVYISRGMEENAGYSIEIGKPIQDDAE